MKIGFVGLGNMGGRLASRLAGVGDLTVYDAYEPSREAFRGRARVAGSIAGAGAGADVVGVCVRTGEQVRECADALLPVMQKGSMLMIHSTVSPGLVLTLAQEGAARGVEIIDAPATVTRYGVPDGPFVCTMIGAEETGTERVRPLLDAYATETVHTGRLGTGMSLKIINNLVSLVQITVAEGAVLVSCRDRGVEDVTTTALVRFDLSAGADVDGQVQRAREDIDQAAGVGATSVYTLTGSRVYADWSANVDSYATLAKDLVDYAAVKNISIAVEPTNWLYADLTFIYSFRDAVEFSSQAGLRVCLDLFHVWTESDRRQTIEEHVDLLSHVQISDMQRGARAVPCRAVPGDGDVPIRAMVGWLLEAGYARSSILSSAARGSTRPATARPPHDQPHGCTTCWSNLAPDAA